MTERSQIEEIKQRLDIVQVAQGYLRSSFKNTGRNTFTVCPFHSEKSPSFSLNSDLGIYKCFGCGESGDVIKFIEKIEGVDFPTALQIAADKAGITLVQGNSTKNEKLEAERKRIIEANSLTAEFYHFLLFKHASGQEARDYTAKRKIRKKELKEFKIGFAPKGFENLKNYLTKKGFKLEELVKWGLLVEKNGKIYDKFRNRLMFPILNHRGEIVGFSGRTLEQDGIPKYLNSPETIVYKKSSILFGLYQAKDSIRKNNFAIIAEGNMEPLTSRKSDIENVVVPMGTALTEAQLMLIKRYCDRIYFAFDTDNAGQNALIRSFTIADRAGFTVKAIQLGKYKDPDEMIAVDPKLWSDAVDNALDIIDFLIKLYSKKFDITKASEKSLFVKSIMPYIQRLSDGIQREHYIKKISEITDLAKDTLTNVKQVEPTTRGSIEKEKTPESGNLNKEEYLTAVFLRHYKEYSINIAEFITDLTLSSLIKKLSNDQNTDLNEEEREIYMKLSIARLPVLDSQDRVDNEIGKVILTIRKITLKDEILKLKREIALKEKLNEDTSDLLMKVTNLVQEEARIDKKL